MASCSATASAGDQVANPVSLRRAGRGISVRFATLVLAAVGVALVFAPSQAIASRQAVNFFAPAESGTLGGQFSSSPSGIAVNNTGNGGVPAGTIYVTDPGTTFSTVFGEQGAPERDGRANRIERFERDDHGTLTDSSDDTYRFVSAWGAGVDSTVGGNDYEICTVAAQCQAGLASAGNGTAAGNGSLNNAKAIAVDQDSGDVYVSDAGNTRVNVYEADGTFLRSFGYDVVASGPDAIPAPSEKQQLTVKASGGKFSLSFRGRATGPRGTGWRSQVGTKTLILVVPTEGSFAVGQGISGVGIAPGTTITAVGNGTLTLSQPTTESTVSTERLYGDTFAHDASAAEIETVLNALPSIGGVGGSVTVTGGPGDAGGSSPYVIEFGGSLAGEDMPPIEATSGGLTNGSGASATVTSLVDGGAYEVCKGESGDVCKAGGAGSGVGEVGEGWQAATAKGIAVSQGDGNPATGTVFLADTANRRVNTYNLDGSSPSSFGSATDFESGAPSSIAIDSRGIAYIANGGLSQEAIERYDTQNVNGGGVGFLAPIAAPPLTEGRSAGLAVAPDSDGAGPDTDVLYVLRDGGGPTKVLQVGPANAPGLAAPPTASDEEHGTDPALFLSFKTLGSLAIDQSSGDIYVGAGLHDEGAGRTGCPCRPGVYILGKAGPPPTASLDSIGEIASTSAQVNATINPNGPPNTSYTLEYSLDGTSWSPEASVLVGAQESPQNISAVLSPAGGGLLANTQYHVRLAVGKVFSTPIVTSEKTFTTLAASPKVETTGSPIRTATTVRLEGRVNPRNSATSYRFEYGDQGSCGANPCESSEPVAAGADGTFELVSAQVERLQPGSTYHYRVVAENGAAEGPSFGEDATVTTRTSDLPLSHGHFPGPPGSDRAYEQVSIPDTGGNPTVGALAVADDGEGVVYQVHGGNPTSNTGNLNNQLYAERTANIWETRSISPAREELVASGWLGVAGRSDLSSLATLNTDNGIGNLGAYRISPNTPASKVFEIPGNAFSTFGVSDDASRVVMLMSGSWDASHPVSSGTYLYDVASGTPQMVSLLPGNTVPACGVLGSGQGFDYPINFIPRAPHWLSADGELAFFPSRGNDCDSEPQLYLRELDAGQSKLVSRSPISGPACGAAFLRATPGAVFFRSDARLVAEDTAPGSCGNGGGDVYRYDLDDESLKCLTCVVVGLEANVGSTAIAEDGSRLYFTSPRRLLPGAATGGIYRVDVESGDLAYVGSGAAIGISARTGQAINPDGSVLVFSSNSPALNAVGGQQNGGTRQYYRYDDRDRSLICVSCPQDGSAPKADVEEILVSDFFQTGPNVTPLSDDGETLAFTTPSSLASADQNTAATGQNPETGADVYEWRDGRQLLVTDGLTSWPTAGSGVQAPEVSAVSRSGKDVYFTAAAQYTPDALDGYARLYDARIGGGFEFPPPPKPCPLEVCQGTPKGAPEEAPAGTAGFTGPGKAQQKQTQKKKANKKAHKKKHHHRTRRHRASDNRGAQR